jgi:hypothetical protein
MKYCANIFKKTVVKPLDPESIAFVETLHHALVEIFENELVVETKNGLVHKFHLQFNDEDAFTTTHHGIFRNGTPFRFIQPIGFSLEMTKMNQSSMGGFSIGSLDPSGWAFNFSLTEPKDPRNTYLAEGKRTEHLENLIVSFRLAFESGLQEDFIKFGSRILSLVKDEPQQIYLYEEGEETGYKLRANASMFSEDDQRIISKIKQEW